MQYSYHAKNTIKDNIYYTRLILIEKYNIDILKSSKMYSYYMSAYLGNILIPKSIYSCNLF